MTRTAVCLLALLAGKKPSTCGSCGHTFQS